MNTRVCKRCDNEKDITEFYKHKKSLEGRRRVCIQCYTETCKTYEARTIGDRQCKLCGVTKTITDFSKDPGNPEGRKVWCKECLKKKTTYYRNKDNHTKETYRLKNREAYKKYSTENRGKIQARWALRKSRKLRAVPKWADLNKIKEVYQECRRLTEETGIKYHVDHIIPLVNPIVSGLHVLENLRIIPATENLKKNNSYEIN